MNYDGVLVATTHGDGTVTIERADPRITVSARFLEDIAEGITHLASLDGDVLKIHGTNRTVIYRIGEKVPDLYAYHAEWPD